MHNNPLTRDKVGTLKDVTLTALGDGEILVSSSGIWINQTLAEAGIAAAANVLLKDGSVALTGNLSAGGYKITSLGTPTSSGDAASKSYVDALLQGLDLKASVRAATTAAGTLATDFENGDTLDGVTLATGNRILIKNQSTASENGIYVVAASGAPTRAADFAAAATVAGAYCFVEEGTTNADKGFVCTSNSGSDVVGTNNLSFTQFNGAGGVSALDDLSDVAITGLSNGHVLYVSGGVFVNASLATAGIAAASHTHTASNVTDFNTSADARIAAANLSDLNNVNAGSPSDNDVLSWDAGTSQWIAEAPSGGGSGSAHWHDPVECVTTANVDLAGGGIANGTTHDGYTVATGNRILVANQSSAAENGIYIVPASGTASRASDMAASYNASGDVVAIKRGTTYSDFWAVVTSNSSVVGTDPITIALVDNGASTVAANLFKGGPVSGSAANPTYRTIAPADLPAAVQGWQANHLVNTSFRTWGHAVTSPVTLTDGAYVGPTGWFFLSSGTTCTVGTGTGLGNSASSIVLTNNSGSNRRMGASQFVEYYDCLGLRGKEVTFTIKVKRSASGNVRAALVNWTGTANSPTKDIVNDWTSSTYTEGNFFVSSANLDIIAVSSAVSVGTSATAVSVTGTVGASTNNLQVIVWSEDNIADAGTIEFSEAVLSRGATAVSYEIQPYDFEMFRCDYRCRLHSSDSSQTDAILGWGHGASTTVAVCQVPLGHGMRVVPTLSYTAADWQVADSVGARQDVTALAISSTVSSRRILFMTSTVASGLTVGRGMATVADTTAGRYLVLDAEIGV